MASINLRPLVSLGVTNRRFRFLLFGAPVDENPALTLRYAGATGWTLRWPHCPDSSD